MVGKLERQTCRGYFRSRVNDSQRTKAQKREKIA